MDSNEIKISENRNEEIDNSENICYKMYNSYVIQKEVYNGNKDIRC